MIISKIMGGLGNQMFCYAAGRAVAERNKVALKLDTRGYPDLDGRTFELWRFDITAVPASPRELARCDRRSHNRKINRALHKLRFWRSYGQSGHFRQRGYAFDEEFMKVGGDAYLEGLFQSEKFFVSAAETLRREFQVQDEHLDTLTRAMAARMKSCESVSLHVRRSDYVNHPRYRHVVAPCSLEYYQKALGIIRERVTDPHVFVFSDEPEWCRANLPLDGRFTVIDANPPEKPWLDLHLMTSCRHHVLANSSFSWWGAWLAESKDQIVVAPAQWLLPDSALDDRDIVPERWIRI